MNLITVFKSSNLVWHFPFSESKELPLLSPNRGFMFHQGALKAMQVLVTEYISQPHCKIS